MAAAEYSHYWRILVSPPAQSSSVSGLQKKQAPLTVYISMKIIGIGTESRKESEGKDVRWDPDIARMGGSDAQFAPGRKREKEGVG